MLLSIKERIGDISNQLVDIMTSDQNNPEKKSSLLMLRFAPTGFKKYDI